MTRMFCSDYYESIRVPFDISELSELNVYQNNGWYVVAILGDTALLERHWVKEKPLVHSQ